MDDPSNVLGDVSWWRDTSESGMMDLPIGPLDGGWDAAGAEAVGTGADSNWSGGDNSNEVPEPFSGSVSFSKPGFCFVAGTYCPNNKREKGHRTRSGQTVRRGDFVRGFRVRSERPDSKAKFQAISWDVDPAGVPEGMVLDAAGVPQEPAAAAPRYRMPGTGVISAAAIGAPAPAHAWGHAAAPGGTPAAAVAAAPSVTSMGLPPLGLDGFGLPAPVPSRLLGGRTNTPSPSGLGAAGALTTGVSDPRRPASVGTGAPAAAMYSGDLPFGASPPAANPWGGSYNHHSYWTSDAFGLSPSGGASPIVPPSALFASGISSVSASALPPTASATATVGTAGLSVAPHAARLDATGRLGIVPVDRVTGPTSRSPRSPKCFICGNILTQVCAALPCGHVCCVNCSHAQREVCHSCHRRVEQLVHTQWVWPPKCISCGEVTTQPVMCLPCKHPCLCKTCAPHALAHSSCPVCGRAVLSTAFLYS